MSTQGAGNDVQRGALGHRSRRMREAKEGNQSGKERRWKVAMGSALVLGSMFAFSMWGVNRSPMERSTGFFVSWLNAVYNPEEVELTQSSLPADHPLLSILDGDDSGALYNLPADGKLREWIERRFSDETCTFRGTYNKINPKRKYFLYSPAGGFNNQRRELAHGMYIAKTLGRDLIVPPAAKHTNIWVNYEHTKQVYPMDCLLDFTRLSNFGPRLVALNTSIVKFTKEMEKLGLMIQVHRPQPEVMSWKGAADIRTHLGTKDLSPDDKPILFLRGGGMYHLWCSSSMTRKIQKNVIYVKELRDFTIELTKDLGNYSAVHVRLGDYVGRGRTPDTQGMIRKLKSAKNFQKNQPLYIATDSANMRTRFRPFRTFMSGRLVFSNDLPRDLVNAFLRRYPEDSRLDYFGLIEQLICVKAKAFAGTDFSTFTKWINDMRSDRQNYFPEVFQSS